MMLKPCPKVRRWDFSPYRDFVRSQPCSVPKCGCPDTVAHHEQAKGHGAKGQKCGDERTLSLCIWHHQVRHQQGRGIWAKWGVYPEAAIIATQNEWVRRGGERQWEEQTWKNG